MGMDRMTLFSDLDRDGESRSESPCWGSLTPSALCSPERLSVWLVSTVLQRGPFSCDYLTRCPVPPRLGTSRVQGLLRSSNIAMLSSTRGIC